MISFFKGFATTLKFRPFLKLCAATFLVFNGFIMIASFQAYVIIYYVSGGDQKIGSEYLAYAGTTATVSAFLVVILITYVGTKIGKRRAFFLSTGISIAGYGLKWFCYNPEYSLVGGIAHAIGRLWPGRVVHLNAVYGRGCLRP